LFERSVFSKAFHGLDHAYIFTEGYTSNFQVSYTDADFAMSDALTNLLTNFVKTGKPQLEEIQDGMEWPPYSTRAAKFLRINTPFSVSENFYHPNVTFWGSLLPSLFDYVSMNSSESSFCAPLSVEERQQLEAFRKAWWALWILVGTIAFVLWTVVVCILTKRWINAQNPRPYTNIVVTNT